MGTLQIKFSTLAERDAYPLWQRRINSQQFEVAETGLSYVLVGGVTNAHFVESPESILRGGAVPSSADNLLKLYNLMRHLVYFEVNPELATYPILLMEGSAKNLSETLGRGINSCTYDVRLLSSTVWTTGNTLAAVASWITSQAITTEKWEIRAVPVFASTHVGESQVILKFGK